MPNPLLASAVARAFLAGEQTVEEVTARASLALGRNWRWFRTVAPRYIETFAGRTRPRHREVVQFLLHDGDFHNACERYPFHMRVAHGLTGQPGRMQPVAAAETWEVPAIESARALADWLFLNAGGLDWFADLKGLGYSQHDRPFLRHYHYRVLAKKSGSIRLIEAPKPRLKELQRQILTELLEKIRRIRRCIEFRGPDSDILRTAGYPEAVADLLGGICTNATRREVWRESVNEMDPGALWDLRKLYSRPHLPQGAPTSPALANLCAYRFDCRLDGLAKVAGAEYTRYADDLAFSGGEAFERRVEHFATRVAAISMEEGFGVNHRKTRIMRQGVRQHLTGVVTNQRLNIMRADYDLLKAVLFNCVRHGRESQNRDGHARFRAHLDWRVGFVGSIHSEKGRRLRALFERIQWI
jgi:RNA-directed DNA polymerase